MRPANTTIVTLLSEVARSFVGFFVTLYLARELGASVLGSFFVVIALVVWLKIPVNAVGSAMTKRVSEGKSPSVFLGAGGSLYLALTCLVAVGILFFRGAVNAHVGAPVAYLVAMLFVGNGFFSFVTDALDGQKRVATSSLLKAVENILEGGAQVAFVLIGYELFGLIGGQIVALIGGGVIGLALFRFRPAFPGRNHLESLIEYARYSWLGTVSGRTFGWMDTLVLSFFVSNGLIGVYEIAWRLASLLVLLSNAIQRTLFPEISDLAMSNETAKIRFFLNEALYYAGLIAIPGFFGAMILGPKILRIYGAEFAAGGTVLLILIFARLINAYGSQLLSVVNGVDRPDIAFRINGIFVGSNLLLNVALVYVYGWYGAAVATALSSSFTALLGFRAVRNLVGDVDLPIFGILRQLMAGGVMAGIITWGRIVVPITSMYHTIGYVSMGAGIYLFVMVIISNRFRGKILSIVNVPVG